MLTETRRDPPGVKQPGVECSRSHAGRGGWPHCRPSRCGGEAPPSTYLGRGLDDGDDIPGIAGRGPHFEPFFNNCPAQASGLVGSCRCRIVQQHHGHIDVVARSAGTTSPLPVPPGRRPGQERTAPSRRGEILGRDNTHTLKSVSRSWFARLSRPAASTAGTGGGRTTGTDLVLSDLVCRGCSGASRAILM
jgi:hypothetical protein